MPRSTPSQVAIQSAFLIAVTSTALVLVILFFLSFEFSWLAGALIFISIGITSYSWIYWSIEKFIYQKIKIIYKTIHRFKSGKDVTKDISMTDDMLAEVNKDVMRWAEGRIQEIRDLRQKDSFRKEFIGNLSHELKTPVFSIQGYILTLLEGALEDPENNRKFLEKAAKGVDRITLLLQDLDSITRIESGMLKLNKEKFDLVELTKEMFDSVEQKAKKSSITLKLNNPGGNPVLVNADRSKIAQVLTNLLVNSLNYGTEGGYCKLRFYDMDENVLIEVADNGIGISEEHLSRVFERFYRVDKSRSRNVGGSGLGLAIVKHIIEGHGQTINVRSTEGVGSTFSFTLEKA